MAVGDAGRSNSSPCLSESGSPDPRSSSRCTLRPWKQPRSHDAESSGMVICLNASRILIASPIFACQGLLSLCFDEAMSRGRAPRVRFASAVRVSRVGVGGHSWPRDPGCERLWRLSEIFEDFSTTSPRVTLCPVPAGPVYDAFAACVSREPLPPPLPALLAACAWARHRLMQSLRCPNRPTRIHHHTSVYALLPCPQGSLPLPPRRPTPPRSLRLPCAAPRPP